MSAKKFGQLSAQWDEDATKYIQKQFELSSITPNHVSKHGSIFNNVLEQLWEESSEKTTSYRQELRDARIRHFEEGKSSDDTPKP